MKKLEHSLETFIFASRWLQAPLFVGLIVASLLYAYRFLLELLSLFSMVHDPSPERLLLGVLGLVDMIMVANLIFMIIIGGYTLFVSKLNIGDNEDRPEWLDKTTAATLKIKLASALVGVSGIHLLKTFIELGGEVNLHGSGGEHAVAEHVVDNTKVMWQVVIHVVFLFSALILSISEWILHPPERHHTKQPPEASH
ncbi:MAG: TIGR00645 family protein [Pirellula sp.]